MKEKKMLFHEYFFRWFNLYKRNAVRSVTFKKYVMTHQRLKEIAPNLKMCDLTRGEYQNIISTYAETHEKQTVLDFHCHLKGCIVDALDDGILTVNPTKKVIITGKMPREKKAKYLNEGEFKQLLAVLKLDENKINWDWFIFFMAKTGLRFSEALGLTVGDFDFEKMTVKVDKTFDYKETDTFVQTKNSSSKRKVKLDWDTNYKIKELLKNKSLNELLFVKPGKRVFNSTVNNILKRRCKEAGVPIISAHSLRHTHASILLGANISLSGIAQRWSKYFVIRNSTKIRSRQHYNYSKSIFA